MRNGCAEGEDGMVGAVVGSRRETGCGMRDAGCGMWEEVCTESEYRCDGMLSSYHPTACAWADGAAGMIVLGH